MTTQTETPDGEVILKQMLDGLEGVSEGDWEYDTTETESGVSYYTTCMLLDGDGYVIADAINATAADIMFESDGEGDGEVVDRLAFANFHHIARCSPDNIRAIAEYVTALTAERDAALARVRELEGLINTPETEDFVKAVPLEAAHQIERWGVEHDAGKSALDWFWVVGYLSQKAVVSQQIGDVGKAKHHCITTAALCLNWHRHLSRDDLTKDKANG